MRFVIALVAFVALTACSTFGPPSAERAEAKCVREITGKTGHPFVVTEVKGLGPWTVLGTAGDTAYRCHVSKQKLNTSITEVDRKDSK